MYKRLLQGLWLLCLSVMVRAQAGYEYRYWFDAGDGAARTGQTTDGNWRMELDLDGVALGFHTLHVQVKDTAQRWSAPVTRYFLKTADDRRLTCRYTFDDNPQDHPLNGWARGAALIDVNALDDGFHRIHFLLGDGDGMSSLRTDMFIKIPPTEGVDYMTCHATVDNRFYKQDRLPTAGGVVKWNLDVSSLEPGLHQLQAVVSTPAGAAAFTSQMFFFRTATDAELGTMRCYYSIDGAETFAQAGVYGGGAFHFDIDVAALEDGLHRIAYFLADEKGSATRLNGSWFIKTPVGGNGIVRYDYWLNEQSDRAQSVTPEGRPNPYDLIALLPVETCPIRSSSFRFAPGKGEPVIYACNELHVRFYDVAGRFTDLTRSYVDEKVSRKVTDATPLTSGRRHEKPRPQADEIHWFTLQAQTGDSLTFRTSQAATVQLFAPSGEEVYNASGAASVNYGGCYAYEDGTYYVALHDVTGTYGSTIGLDYEHIDKYAVLRHTPSSVGVSPSGFTMQLYGNGFEKLQSAALLHKDAAPEAEPIKAATIAESNKAETALRFNLTGEESYGDYNLLLTFKDADEVEELLVENALTFAQPVYGDVDITVKDVKTLAMPYPVTIKVKNTGNVPYIMLPLNIAYDNVDNVSDFALENFCAIIDKEYVDAGLKLDVVTENLLGTGAKGRMFNFMIPEIGPEEEIELTVSFVAAGHTRFNLYAWTDKAWSLSTHQVARDASFAKARKTILSTDCMPDPCEAISGILGNLEECSCGMIMANVDALANLYMAMIMRNNLASIRAAGYSSYREMREALGIEMDMFERLRLRNPNSILLQLLSHCGEERLTAAVEMLLDLQRRQAEDDCPKPPRIPIEILVPGDPNDMLGYTSESGSKYIRKGVRNVFYTIEFENDPELATASAHTIVVKDTLDASRFDLSTFEPTGVKIGHVSMACDGSQSFVRTMDLRPAINVIAEVELEYEEAKGIATWTIRSLDPMTMEPSDNPMEGALPINSDGNGQGEFMFNIKLKDQFDDGTTVGNRASIVFDREGAILTPTWVNVIDTVAPVSRMSGSEIKNDSTLTLSWRGTDNRSGVWRYDVYVQDGSEAPWRKAAENVTDTLCDFRFYEGMSYGFCVVATDSAGNVEQKALVREYGLESFKPGDANGDGVVDAEDAALVRDYYLGAPVHLNLEAADVSKDGVLDAEDTAWIREIFLSTSRKNSKRERRVRK